MSTKNADDYLADAARSRARARAAEKAEYEVSVGHVSDTESYRSKVYGGHDA